MNLGQILIPKIIFVGILMLFAIKGVILSFLMPIFQNPDEPVHYATISHLAEPKEKNWPIKEREPTDKPDASQIATYGFSEETIRSAQAIQFDEVKSARENTQDFSRLTNEKEILNNDWKHYIDTYPANTSGTLSVYYMLASLLERLLSDENILVRMFSMRLLTTIFGIGVLVLAYLITKKVCFSEYVALLLTTLIAFHPMLSITAAQINIDIALIFAFSLFVYAGVSLLQEGFRSTSALLAILAAILGFFSKGPGIVLVVMLYPLFVWLVYQKHLCSTRKFFLRLLVVTITFISISLISIPQSYLIGITKFTDHSLFPSPLTSVGQYLDATMDSGELRDTVRSYWGHFGWLDHAIPEWILSMIILITLVGFIGTLWYLFSQKKFEYLPEKKYLIFFLGMIIMLQIAIRFYDWRVFDVYGSILIGQPGRYFLPNIIAHLLIVITGIGFLLRQENRFVLAMKILTLAMILLQLHAIMNVIVPRYYL